MMKTFLTILASLLVMTSYAIETTKCYLAHDGAMTVYDASQFTTAISNAVKGDTIYLQEGTYAGFTLDKEITIRGVGDEKTKITGDISIAIVGSPKLSQTLLEGLYLNAYSVALSKAMTGVKIKQCKFKDFTFNADCSDVELDRCQITGGLNQSSYIKGLTLSNSRIKAIIGSETYTANACKYLNCNIYELVSSSYTRYINGHFVNCIIASCRVSSTSYTLRLQNSVFSNTLRLCNWDSCLGTGNVIQDCYQSSTYKLGENCELTDYTYDDLIAKNYLGNDGTVVGCYGGTSPFTLTLPIPKITSSDIFYDKDNKILEVTIQVNAK